MQDNYSNVDSFTSDLSAIDTEALGFSSDILTPGDDANLVSSSNFSALQVQSQAILTDLDSAGNSRDLALDLGIVAPVHFTKGSLGSDDKLDYYRFHTDKPGNLEYFLTGLSDNANVQLLDSNGNNLSGSYKPGRQSEYGTYHNSSPGSYYLLVYGGDTDYSLCVELLKEDNTLYSARELGLLDESKHIKGNFGSDDKLDYYRFRTDESGDLDYSLTGLSQNANIQLLDSNGNNLSGSYNPKTQDERKTTALEAGEYYFLVYGEDTDYDLFFELRSDLAGNSLDFARDLGVVVERQTAIDSVGNNDKLDYYRFRTDKVGDLEYSLTELSNNANIQLLDSNGQNISGSYKPGSEDEYNTYLNLPVGEYYFLVYGGNTKYNFAFELQADGAGNSLTQARNLGMLTTLQQLEDRVGSNDQLDYYYFTTDRTGDLDFSLTGLFNNANIQLLDRNGNNLSGSYKPGSQSEFGTYNNLLAGDYYFLVYGGDTSYDLSLELKFESEDLNNSIDLARDLGLLTATKTVSDRLSSTDKLDYYHFRTDKSGDLDFSLTGLFNNANIQLLDRDGNNLSGSYKPGSQSEYGNYSNLAAGEYYFLVYGGDTSYSLTFDLIDRLELTVISPNADEKIEPGENISITWKDNIAEDVDIDLYRNDVFFQNIADNTASDGQLDWQVPTNLPLGDRYQIKVTKSDDDNLSDLSDSYFSLYQPYISFLSIDLNSRHIGKEMAIEWLDNLDEEVQIDLYQDNALVKTIAEATPSDGQYLWKIPEDLAEGDGYKIQVLSIDYPDLSQETIDFSLFEPKLKIVSPNTNSYTYPGDDFSLRWSENLFENVRLDLYKGDEFIEEIYEQEDAYDSSFNWQVPENLEPGSDYRIKIYSTEDSQLSNFSDNYFSIYEEVPKIDFVSTPNAISTRQADRNTDRGIIPGTDLEILWEDNLDENVRLDLYYGNDYLQTIDTDTPSDGEYIWSIPSDLAESTILDRYQIKVSSVNHSSIQSLSTNLGTPRISVRDFREDSEVINELKAGSRYLIGWDNNHIFNDENVRIDLYQDETFVENIVASTSAANKHGAGLYWWTVPTDIDSGTGYQIKVSLAEHEVGDTSDNSFAIDVPSIEVLQPNDNDVIDPGSSFKILWDDSFDTDDNIIIELYQQDSLVDKITTIYDWNNTGEYNWRIPNDLTAGSDYRIKLSSENNEVFHDFSDNNFTVAPEITLYDAINAYYFAGTTYNIDWESNLPGNIRLELYEGDDYVQTIVDSIPNSGRYIWDVPEFVGDNNNYRIKLVSVDDDDVSAFEDLAPKITLLSPSGGNLIEPGANYEITWDANFRGAETAWYDDYGDTINLDLFRNDTLVQNIARSVDIDDPKSSYLWNVPSYLASALGYTIRVSNGKDSSIYDFSDKQIAIREPSFRVVDLYENESFRNGDQYEIAWVDDFDSDVRIDLYQRDTYDRTIVESISSGGADAEFGTGSYEWTIPEDLAAGDGYKLKIASVEDDSLSDFSNLDFSIYEPSIEIDIPAEFTTLVAGENGVISWSDNLDENVRIELYLADSLVEVIDPSTPSDGFYRWTLPTDFEQSEDYQIKITSVLDENIADFSDDSFTINSQSIDINSPDGGNSLTPGENYSIGWFNNTDDNLRLELYKGDALVQTIEHYLPSDGTRGYQTYDWLVPQDLAEGTDYKLKITSVDNDSLSDRSEDHFTVQPKIKVDISDIGSTKAGQQVKIDWNDNINENVRINLYEGSFNFVQTIEADTPSDGEFVWTVPNGIAEGDNYKIKIESVEDSNINNVSNNSFRIYDPSGLSIRRSGTVQAGVNEIIYFTNTISDRVQVDLYQGDTFVQKAFAYGDRATDQFWRWEVPTNVSGGDNYRLKIYDLDDESISDFSQPFTLFKPEIEVTYPNIKNILPAGGEVEIEWKDNLYQGRQSDGVEEFGIFLHRGINDRYPQRIAMTAFSRNGEGSYLWDIPNYDPRTDYRIEVVSLDYFLDSKNVGDFTDGFFTIR